MKRLSLFLVVFFLTTTCIFATIRYVRPDGNNNWNTYGLYNTPQGAWKTIKWACDHLQAGDTLIVEDGVYEEVGSVIIHDLISTQADPVVIKARNHLQVFIRGSEGNHVVHMVNCRNIIFEGFDVTFLNFDKPDDYKNGILAQNTFRLTIRNCYVHDNPASGIQVDNGEYITIENNLIKANASKTGNPNGSGISVYHPVYDSNYQSGDWGIIIRNNICFENVCPFTEGGSAPTDGNGIILDDFQNTQTYNAGGQAGGYYHPALVENNLCFNNGGRGIHAYHSDNATIRNNTLYHNMYELSKYQERDYNGDLNVDASSNTKIYNNIVVMRPTNMINNQIIGYALLVTATTEIHNNLIIGRTGQVVYGSNNQASSVVSLSFAADNKVKPLEEQNYVKFVNPTYNVSPFVSTNPQFSNYFGLATSSSAINTGDNSNKPADDLEGVARTIGGIADIGCYESNNSGEADTIAPSAPTNLAVTNTTSSSISFSWTASTDNVGVTGYEVYTNGSLTANVTGTGVTVSNLSASTSYNFTVKAKDAAANNVSAASSTLTASTTSSSVPTPTNLHTTGVTQTSVHLEWTAAGGNAAGYHVYRNGDYVNTTAATDMNVTDLLPGTTYSFKVRAETSTGVLLGTSDSIFVTTAPSASTNLHTTSVSSGTVHLAWDAAGGNAAGYHVYKNGDYYNTTAALDMGITGLQPATSYTFHVIAETSTGAHLGSSDTISVTTISTPTPSNLRTTSVTSTEVHLAWDAAGGNAAGYHVYKNGDYYNTTAALDMRVSGLSPGTTYTFKVRAETSLGVLLGISDSIIVTTTSGSRISSEKPVMVESLKLQAFPNPSTQGESISVQTGTLVNKNVQLYIHDLTGKCMMNKKMFFSNVPAKVSLNLPKGMYILSITDGVHREQTKMVIH